ncbi:hypothetical protein SAY86_018704 [Trapa natans]|uniref:Protein EARLY FLOWERING 4 domain-containing protein n=1 Tax=Trapa natans TaxID=22666 RepID=A0AAN7R1Z5_TRANT|nr:hypothetical protein SAY86_018704 [Trapa natans]
MKGDLSLSTNNGREVDATVPPTFLRSFLQVQDILDQNSLLINEINHNHKSRNPDNLSRNVGLIRLLNKNVRRAVDIYADLPTSMKRSVETTSQGESRSSEKPNPERPLSG